MNKFCLYADTCESAPCFAMKINKYSYLSDFIQGNKKTESKVSVPLEINCLQQNNNKFLINEKTCINCLFCLFGCIGNRVLINKNIQPTELCIDISSYQFLDLKNHILPTLFRGNFIKLSPVPFSELNVNYKTFEDFTSVNETKNIAIWTANVLKYLSQSNEPRVALEVGLPIQVRDRGGRLDVSVFHTEDKILCVAETKVTFEKMMNEGRYQSQLMAYEQEMSRVCCENSVRYSKILVIGGAETDLLPNSHPSCTQKIGNRALEFYSVVKQNNFFFVSANALLALGLKKMFESQEKYCLEKISKLFLNSNYIGLLSSGIVTRKDEIIEL